ncbi:granzyme B(G,H)-like [Equus quagga]|uniref:granzyme B(G,H)-like n=1 Tax=Equus quagga TaxID=89248 RepID=UPI001EE30A23|nr:granzyme B(G,H)-like [Equus quagga]
METQFLWPNYNKTTQLCVGDPKEKKSSYKGDSGGPLVCKNVIQGIVSYGPILGIPPGAFTKVSSFLPWIKKTMKGPARWRSG